MFDRFNLDKTYQYLLITLAFLMPLTVSLANLVIVFIVLIWMSSGNYKTKLSQIFNSKFLMSSIVFYSIHLFGMLWTEDLEWGFHILHKMWYFLLLLPILYTIVQKEYIRYYLISFLLAIALTEVISFMVWFEVIDEFMKAEWHNPTPFMSHVSFNPFLAFTIYLVVHEIMFNRNMNKILFCAYGFFSIVMTINMFITGGRAGQVMFFAIIVILSLQFFRREKIKALLAILILIPGIFFTAYQTSPLFKERILLAKDQFTNYSVTDVATSQKLHSSIGGRILFTLNSWEIIKKHPVLGVGTGDFPEKYKEINQQLSPNGPHITNPHNMYILVLAQSGIIGLVSMISIFYFQIRFALNSSNAFSKNVGLALPILFLIIMLSDSYLLGHFTGLLFIFFSSFLYRDFEKT